MSDEVENAAVPEASVAVPSRVDPSRNWTVPVAVEGVTAAVKVTDWPGFAGFALDRRATVEGVLTTWLTTGEVELTVLESPLYTAVIE